MKQQDILKTLDTLYTKVLEGIPPKKEAVVPMAERYLQKSASIDDAALALINSHLNKFMQGDKAYYSAVNKWWRWRRRWLVFGKHKGQCTC